MKIAGTLPSETPAQAATQAPAGPVETSDTLQTT